MTRGLMAVIGLLVLAMVLTSIASRYEIDGLETQLDSIGLVSAATDVLISQVRQDAASDSVRADSVEAVLEAVRSRLQVAQTVARAAVVRRDSAWATVDPDTLDPGCRNLLALERGVAESEHVELDLERQLRISAEAELARIRPILDTTRLLLFAVQAERDSSLAVGRALLAQLNPGFWRGLLADLPEKVACGAGGATVAAFNDGDVMLGAGIGLAVCLVVGAVL